MKLNPIIILIVVIIGGYVGLKINNIHNIKNENTIETVSNTSTKQQTKNGNTPKKVKEIGLKQVLSVGNVLFRVDKVSTEKSISDGFTSYTADGTFLIVYVSLKNVSNEAITTDSSFFQIYLRDKKYSPTDLLSVDGQFMYDGLNPGIQKSGRIFFDIPVEVANSKNLILDVQTGLWGSQQGQIHLR